MTQFNNIG